MRNDDPQYVTQLEAALESSEKEIKMLEDENKRLVGELMDATNGATFMGEIVIADGQRALKAEYQFKGAKMHIEMLEAEIAKMKDQIQTLRMALLYEDNQAMASGRARCESTVKALEETK